MTRSRSPSCKSRAVPRALRRLNRSGDELRNIEVERLCVDAFGGSDNVDAVCWATLQRLIAEPETLAALKDALKEN